MKNSKSFDRWKCIRPSSWALTVYNNHEKELWKMYMAFEITQKFTYKQFRDKPKSTWDEPILNYFSFSNPLKPNLSPFYINNMTTIKDWSNALNDFQNWINLNTLLILAANLETYIAKVTKFSLLSDLGVLFGYDSHIDGIHLLKYAQKDKIENMNKIIDDNIVCFTKGTGDSRINRLSKIFKNLDDNLLSNEINALEKIRKIRNDLAHTFGREIERVQNNLTPEILPIKKISREQILKLQHTVWKVVKHIDIVLLNHIGNYEAINIYHNLFSKMSDSQLNAHINMRANLFKKEYGRLGATPVNKEFCRDLVYYYENL